MYSHSDIRTEEEREVRTRPKTVLNDSKAGRGNLTSVIGVSVGGCHGDHLMPVVKQQPEFGGVGSEQLCG